MTSEPTPSLEPTSFYKKVTLFPSVINGRINVAQFLAAAADLVTIVDRFGKALAPVKYDIQGNIDKIKKCYEYDDSSCLLELMHEELNKGKNTAAEGILWLNRALLFFELTFQEVIRHVKSNNFDVNMEKIFYVTYEGSLKRHHNWITQQIFAVICKMCPTLPQMLQSFEVDDDDIEPFVTKLTNFKVTIHLVRCKLDDFFNDNNIFAKK